jgi:hypothetical protein
MEKAYLDRLPADVRFLVERIEHASGVKIEVIIDPSRARGLPDREDSLACEVDKHRARLLIPAPEYFSDASLLHELLHIRRFLVDGVPRIVVCYGYDNWTPELKKGLTRLDNSLEHLIIVPEELKIRPKRKTYWEKVIHRALDQIHFTRFDGDELINWVFIQLVLPDQNLILKADAIITHHRVNDHASQFFAALVPSLHSKESTVQVCLEHLCIPERAVCLEYFDSRNGTRRTIPLTKSRPFIYPALNKSLRLEGY